MRKVWNLMLLLLAVNAGWAQNKLSCPSWRMAEPQQMYWPVFAEEPSVDGKSFDRSALLESVQPDSKTSSQWAVVDLPADSILSAVRSKDQLIQLGGYVKTDRWTKATLNLSTDAVFELYRNGEKLKTQTKPASQAVSVDFTLETGVNALLVKLISCSDTLRFAASVSSANDSARLEWTTKPARGLNIRDVLEGETVADAQLSASGQLVLINTREVLPGTGKVQQSFRVYDWLARRNLFALRNESFQAGWMPQGERLFYQVERNDETSVYVYDVKSGEETLVASGLKSPGRIVWDPMESYFVYTKTEEAEKTGDLKRVFGNDDRIPGTRNRSFLMLFDMKTKLARRLTAGAASTSLHDLKPDGSRILFSTSRMDYTEVPFSKQSLYELDVRTMELDTVWSDKLYGGYCQYSPDGSQLLVSGGPEAFGAAGVKVTEGRIPNSYDTQLFLFNLKTKTAEAISRDFDPSVEQAYWAKDGMVYLSAQVLDYVQLFRFDPKKKNYTQLTVPLDVISSVDFAANKSVVVFRGSSISTPEQLYALDLNEGKPVLLSAGKQEQLAEVEFGRTEDWNFTNAAGTTIYGRVYYPPGYDAAKKYPLIVDYYGGTSPIGRSFGGRYPANVWAAEGYLVYILQPSGATGFGQDFSALHVNGWGRDAIEDIIEGTRQFLAAHPSADAANVGCIGASYGGFTTMMLQTRTDLFKTAIAHAGISDISSYWGEGYWGYSYSGGATKYSYPWNRRDIYVDNSPLFRADKFQNSILLLHGTSDTNVPVGESLQFYAALKILGKEAELVLVDGENHHILDYKKRIAWHNTIMAWFDKKLKNQPEHWMEMYPDKNL